MQIEVALALLMARLRSHAHRQGEAVLLIEELSSNITAEHKFKIEVSATIPSVTGQVGQSVHAKIKCRRSVWSGSMSSVISLSLEIEDPVPVLKKFLLLEFNGKSEFAFAIRIPTRFPNGLTGHLSLVDGGLRIYSDDGTLCGVDMRERCLSQY